MKTAERFVTCLCNQCDQKIEFEAEHAGTTVTCPHCNTDTVLFVPFAKTERPSTPTEPKPTRALRAEAMLEGAHTSAAPAPRPKIGICPACGDKISLKAAVCPHCGEPLLDSTDFGSIFGLVAKVFFSVLLLSVVVGVIALGAMMILAAIGSH